MNELSVARRYGHIAGVLACAFLALPLSAQQRPVEVMLLGVYHFANPGLDEFNAEVDDHFSDRRQAEILKVVERLVTFKPDVVCVEVRPQQTNMLEERFSAFSAGELDLKDLNYGRSETYQLGFRVALELNLSGVLPIDAGGVWLGAPVRAVATAQGLEEFARYDEQSEREMDEETRRFAQQSVLQSLIDLNGEDSLRGNHSFYNDVCPLVFDPDPADSAVAADGQIGAELMGEWYKRNAKMYGNVLRGLSDTDERVLIIVGQGHVPLLCQFFRDHPDFEVVPAKQILDARAPRPLARRDLVPHTYRFDVLYGKLSTTGSGGDGAAFLRGELQRHAVVLLGEYHDSQAVSEFARALVPRLHDAGFRNLGLEVGPTAAALLDECARSAVGTIAALAGHNTRYAVPAGDESYTAIPFFGNVADAEFLAEAVSRDWNLFGIDQEALYGLQPLLDRILESLDGDAALRLRPLFEEARAALDEVYRAGSGGGEHVVLTLPRCAPLETFLSAAASEPSGAEAAAIATDIRTSLEIYRLYGINDWWNSNRLRIRHMKTNLQRALRAHDLDLAEDRLFMKLGAVHTARGLTFLCNYEVGNTLSELADLHGRSTLHMCFMSRYTLEDGALVDGLKDDPRYEVLRDLGRADHWTLVDLRPLKKAVYYDHLTTEPFVKEIFMQHDLVIIPAAEEPPTRNRTR